MPAGSLLSNTEVTLNGMPLGVTNICVSQDMGGFAKYEIEGYLSKAEQTRWDSNTSDPVSDIHNWVKNHAGYQYDPTRDNYTFSGAQLAHYIGTNVGGDKMNGQGTHGSYGYAVKALAEGLAEAFKSGWITDEEAKAEFRLNVNSVRFADEQAEREKDRIEALEAELAELKAEKE